MHYYFSNKIEGEDVIKSAFDKVYDDSKREPKVESIRFSINHLHTWINKSSISLLRDLEKKIGTLQFNLNEYDEGIFNIPSEKLTLTESVIVENKINGSAHSFEEKPHLKITGYDGELRSFYNYFQNATHIKKLIEFLNGTPLHFEYVEFLCVKGVLQKNPQKFYPLIQGRYFFRQIGERVAKAPKNPLTLRSIESEFEDILNNWYSKKE